MSAASAEGTSAARSAAARSAAPSAGIGAGRDSLRSPLRRALDDALARTLAELDFARALLGESLQVALGCDGRALSGERAEQAASRYADLHQRILGLIACQAPVAGDLRLALALLQINDRARRIIEQCLSLLPLGRELAATAGASEQQLRCVREMARLAEEQIADASAALAEGDGARLQRLIARDGAINEHNRRCFADAARSSRTPDDRKAALVLVLMARALERVGDNSVDIARLVTYAA